MEPIVVVMLVSCFTACAVALGITLTVRWWLNRRNRVCPRIRGIAPLSWLWWPSRPARLHRRLRAIVAGVNACLASRRDGEGPLAELVRDLEVRAAAVDIDLVRAASAPSPARWQLVRQVEDEITELGRVAGRIATLAMSAPALVSTPTPELAERLDALEAAHAEIAALEAAMARPRQREVA